MEQQAAGGDCLISTQTATTFIAAVSNIVIVAVLSWFRSRGTRT